MFKKITSMLLLLTLTACQSGGALDGGPCAYQDYPGTCTGQADGKFTYTGTVEGKEVEFKDNGEGWTEGESKSCNLMYIIKGSCNPCGFNLGPCGDAAADAMPRR